MANTAEQNLEERETSTQRIESPLGVASRKFFIFVGPSQQPSWVSSTPSRQPRFGSAKGRIEISDDFNAPLEDFEAYM